MRVYLTDPKYKHTIALYKYIKKYDSNIEIYSKRTGLSCILPYRFSDRSLDTYDLIIPVGAKSVEKILKKGYKNVYLPNIENVLVCLNKKNTYKLAEKVGVPYPRYKGYPRGREKVVIKGSLEPGCPVEYATEKDFDTKYERIKNHYSQKGTEPVIQEYIKGIGVGFFGFYQAGVLKRFFMHRRVREFPKTGGPSASAESWYHPDALKYGKVLLDELNWTGVAMVEFKYNEDNDKLTLMEINPKFWGSTELALAAGINFPELIIRAYKGETIKPVLEPNYSKIRFSWPLDDDLVGIIKYKQWSALKDYLFLRTKTNFGTYGLLLSCYKSLIVVKRILL